MYYYVNTPFNHCIELLFKKNYIFANEIKCLGMI